MPKKNIVINELAGMIKNGFDGVDERFDGANKRFDRIEERVDTKVDFWRDESNDYLKPCQ